MKKSVFLNKGLHYHVRKLFPICRSITGEGIRETLNYFENYNNEFKRIRFKTGEKIFDWQVPEEWEIKDSYIQHLNTGKNLPNSRRTISTLLIIHHQLTRLWNFKNYFTFALFKN